ncbi:MAG TPA: hypothetical protein VJ124_20935 [Pyrinomonadaceae bacterium]|nr:hypothetical protein [Pyrinomonadaceae bacterium]
MRETKKAYVDIAYLRLEKRERLTIKFVNSSKMKVWPVEGDYADILKILGENLGPDFPIDVR